MHLGYYVHLHGSGHAQRAKAIAKHLESVTIIGTGVEQKNWEGVSNYRLLNLPADKIEYVRDLAINRNCQTYSFHYAPYYSTAYRQRVVKLANWVEETQPTAVIVDVSSEITQYLRLLGVPVISVRQHGDRTDLPHLCGYDAAYKLLAPYPQVLESSDVPDWIKEKTIYTPGFSRYSHRQLTKTAARTKLAIPIGQKVVLVLNGNGGNKHSLADIASAAAATPSWLWLVIGKIARDCGNSPDNVRVIGWCEDTYVYLKAADVAIASGGHNTVMELGTAGLPFLCIPEPRPFNEQIVKAEILAKLGLCLVSNDFPDCNAIESILERLKSMDVSKWQKIMSVDGAAQAARAIASEARLLDSYKLNEADENYFKNKTV